MALETEIARASHNFHAAGAETRPKRMTAAAGPLFFFSLPFRFFFFLFPDWLRGRKEGRRKGGKVRQAEADKGWCKESWGFMTADVSLFQCVAFWLFLCLFPRNDAREGSRSVRVGWAGLDWAGCRRNACVLIRGSDGDASDAV